jgi:hypothetical protein
MSSLYPSLTQLSLLNRPVHHYSKEKETTRFHQDHVQPSLVIYNQKKNWVGNIQSSKGVGQSLSWNNQHQSPPPRDEGIPSFQTPAPYRQPFITNNPAMTRGLSLSSISRFPAPSSPLQSPTKGRRPTSPQKKTSRHIMEDLEQEQFDAIMQQAIQKEMQLLLRIIRYEPVSIDEFVALAIGDSMPTGRIIFKLRTFLDSKVSTFLSN